MDRIESIDFEVDSIDGPYGEPIPQAALWLEGDFDESFDDYLRTADVQNRIGFSIDRSTAEELVEKISRYL